MLGVLNNGSAYDLTTVCRLHLRISHLGYLHILGSCCMNVQMTSAKCFANTCACCMAHLHTVANSMTCIACDLCSPSSQAASLLWPFPWIHVQISLSDVVSAFQLLLARLAQVGSIVTPLVMTY